MQDERGYPSGGMGPDESLSDETSSDAWYFETPEERWDRQEAKNRALQDAIRQKLRNEPAKKEPFRAAPPPETPPAERRRGLFGRRGGDEQGKSHAAREQTPDDDWSSEPWNAAPAPPSDAPRKWIEAPEDEAPMSRWDEMFSAKAGDDNIVDAMRKWAESANPTADRANLPPDVEERLKALEGSAPLEAIDAGAAASAPAGLDPDVEARLRAIEAGDVPVPVAENVTEPPGLDAGMEARLAALEAGVPAEAVASPAVPDEPVIFDPEIEARLAAIESTPATDAEGAAAGEPDEPVIFDPEIEARLAAIESTPATDAESAAADEPGEPMIFDPEIEARLAAIESIPATDAEGAAAGEPDEPMIFDPEIEARLAALESEAEARDESSMASAHTEPPSGWLPAAIDESTDPGDSIDERFTDDAPGQSARRWREIFGIAEEPEPEMETPRFAPGEPPAGDEDQPFEAYQPALDEPGASEPPVIGAWDANASTGATGSDWVPDFLQQTPSTPETPVEPAQDDGWNPEYQHPDGEDATEPRNHEHEAPVTAWSGTEEAATAPASSYEQLDPAAHAEPVADAAPEPEAPTADDSPAGAAPPTGILGAAAASVAAESMPEPEREPWGTAWAKDADEDDPWSTARSLTGVPADASPNWPFPEATGEKDADTPAAASLADRQDDDPWAVNPVDELEARLRALEEQAAAAAPPPAESEDPAPGPTAWPAQQLGSSTAWPAQVDYERPSGEGAALYGEAGVLETIDDILEQGAEPGAPPPPVVMGHGFDPSRFAPIREAEDPTPPADADPQRGYLRRPDDTGEPVPGDGTARLLEPMPLTPGMPAEPAADDGGDGDGPPAAPDPTGPEEPAWLRDEERFEDVEARHGSRAKTLIREIVETGMLAVLVFLAVRATFQNFRVEGESMYPTLEDGEFLIVNRLVYAEVDMKGLSTLLPWIDAEEGETKHLFHGPERGDIIVFRDPRDITDDLIKRVIALPGDTIEIRDGVVYINDLELDEPYITEPCTSSCDKSKILLPENEYFVMGDNRNNSHDSRFQDIGLVHEDLIIGKALISYWPKSAFGLAENERPHCVGSPDCKPIEGAESEERAQAAGD